MDDVLLRISREGAVAYGKKQVEIAIEYGAVDEILLADSLLRDQSVVHLIENAEKMQAKIVVLSTAFEPGERLEALGGIAALLRYKMG
jgi:protein pelota